MMPAQVADAVAVRVHEGARVDLVDDAALPPEMFHFARRLRRSSVNLRVNFSVGWSGSGMRLLIKSWP